jgi:hypothetical protein
MTERLRSAVAAIGADALAQLVPNPRTTANHQVELTETGQAEQLAPDKDDSSYGLLFPGMPRP